jgi:hypothetical protein
LKGKEMAIDWNVTVQALMNKAARTDNPAEKDAYMTKALELMTKYGIEDAQLRMKNGKVEKADYEVMLIGAPYTQHKVELLGVVANFLGGQIVTKQGHRSGKVWLFGFKDDIARIKMLYFSLLAQLHLELSVVLIPSGENTRQFREAFHYAFNVTIDRRFQAIQKAINNEPGNEIAIRDRKDDVDSFIETAFGEVVEKPGRQINASSSAGVNAGVSAGSKADIGQSRLRT